MEEWKDIGNGWRVSNMGNVKRPDGKLIRFRSKGYRECEIGKVHRLVAYFFCDPPCEANERWVCDGYEVHHKNRLPWDNRAENLVYLTHEEHKQIHKQKSRIEKESETNRDFILTILNSMRS